jgi:hypothetical protein
LVKEVLALATMTMITPLPSKIYNLTSQQEGKESTSPSLKKIPL